MSKPRVRGVKGLDKALEQLATFDQKAGRRVIVAALRAGNKVILDAAKEAIPVDSGALKAGMRQRARTRRGVPRNIIGFLPAVGWRWRFPEFGTQHMAAQPFMRPAVDTKSDAAGKVVTDAAWKAIQREAKRAASRAR